MHKYLVIFLISLPAVVFSQNCDFDGDGIDDPTSFTQETGLWQSLKSSNNKISARVVAGSFLYPIPGNYSSAPTTNYANIDSTFFWKIVYNSTQIAQIPSFGNIDATVITGHDFNGDGLDDAAKVLNTCKTLKKSCHKNKPSYNFILNNINNSGVPFTDITLQTRFFSKGLSALFVMDANNDGKDDICYANPIRSNKKTFRAICKNVEDEQIVKKLKIGKIFKRPLSAKINNESYVVQWRNRSQKNETRIRLINMSGEVEKITIPSSGETLIGDWLGTGSDQIGVVKDELLIIYNPLNNTTSVKTFPSGAPVDCNNNLYGRATSIFLKTKNVCKVLNCN